MGAKPAPPAEHESDPSQKRNRSALTVASDGGIGSQDAALSELQASVWEIVG